MVPSPKKQVTSNSSTGSCNTTGCNVRVVVRIRPLNDKELLHQSCPVITPKTDPQFNKSLQQQLQNVPPSLSPSKSIVSSLSVGEDGDESCVTLSTSSSTNSRRRSIFQKFRQPKMIKKLLSTKKQNKEAESTQPPTTESTLQLNRKVSASPSSDVIHPTICLAGNRQYEFDAVYGPDTTNEQFNNHCFGTSSATTKYLNEQYLESAASSNVTVLAYGMTGTGKTHTMNMNDGVMSHVVRDIFQAKERNDTPEAFCIKMSCFEIYADEIRDLLAVSSDDVCAMDQSTMKPALKLRDDGERITINGLNEIEVHTPSEIHELLLHAQEQRMTSSTLANDQSSRSHAIYVFTVTCMRSNGSYPVIPAKTATITWTLVDLAGSERIKESGVIGTNRKESIHINTDLFVLGKVISSLHEQKLHVPYRDSKLTRLLRSSLGGGHNNVHSRTIFIACISPADTHMDESLNTLRYAERARSIVNNTMLSNANNIEVNSLTHEQIVAIQEENAILRARITNLSRRQAMNDFTKTIGSDRGGIKLAGIATKLHRAKQEAATIRQRTSFKNKCDNSKVHGNHIAELEALCDSLRQEVDFVNSENDILRLQTNRLQDEIKRLRIMKGLSDDVITELEDSEGDDENDALNDTIADAKSDHDKIRSHAERLLNWADEAIIGYRNNSDVDYSCGGSSSNTSDGTELRPHDKAICPIFRARNDAENTENQFYFSNMKSMQTTASENGCPCEESVFSKQPEVIDFYLPKLGLFCSCGRKDTVPLIGSDPCRIENILRNWQVQFCTTYDIHTATDLIHVYTQNSNQMAKQMRAWRKVNGMKSVKTKSCGIALRIWARTCKIVIKTIQIQKESGFISRPNFLDVALASDNLTVSTLGFCASSTDNAATGTEM